MRGVSKWTRFASSPWTYGVGAAVTAGVDALLVLGVQPSLGTDRERLVALAIVTAAFIAFSVAAFVAQHRRIRALQLSGARLRLDGEARMEPLGDSGQHVLLVPMRNKGDRAALIKAQKLIILDADFMEKPFEITDSGMANPLEPDQLYTIRVRQTQPPSRLPIYLVVSVEYEDEVTRADGDFSPLFLSWGHHAVQIDNATMQVARDCSHVSNADAQRITSFLTSRGISLKP